MKKTPWQGGEVMNCKPGDLAIVVRQFGGGVLGMGMVVTCLDFAHGVTSVIDGQTYDNVWFVEHNGSRLSSRGIPLGMPDDCLRPIRPGDLEDETPTVRELEAA